MKVLREIAREVGFIHTPMDDEALWGLVAEEELSLRFSGLTGVPSFLLNGHFLFSGAQPWDKLVLSLRDAVKGLPLPEEAPLIREIQ